MFIFPLYALATWYFVGRWRRTWLGAATLVVAVLGVAVVWLVYRRLVIWTGSAIPLEGLRILVWGSGALIGFVGLFILVLPRRTQVGHCRWCEYDLRGHEESNPICPECGRALAATPSGERVSGQRVSGPRVSGPRVSGPQALGNQASGEQLSGVGGPAGEVGPRP